MRLIDQESGFPTWTMHLIAIILFSCTGFIFGYFFAGGFN